MAKNLAVLPEARVPPEAENGARELDHAIAQAKRLLVKHFETISNIQSSPMQDAESGDAYTEVSFEVFGEVKDVRVAYDRFTDEWVKAYPFELREQIRFSFSII